MMEKDPEKTEHERKEPACQLCGNKKTSQLKRAVFVGPSVAQVIMNETGSWDEAGWICSDDFLKYQQRYVEKLLAEERGEITTLDKEVLRALHEQEIFSKNPDIDYDANLGFADRLSDKLASFGGSWTFIIMFGCFIFGWMAINSWILFSRPFDPFPFILLNLVLSSLAAIQAPVIMMSQNRQEARDRKRAIHDYQINLKAELEIRQLHQKIDHILSHQWERLMEIQKIQMELIDEIRNNK
ncbi:MAG: DUF1003 domain-containing protein [Chlorobiaceae bacterium]|jgi:uncharacterized membrane protein|nr:DUF1003 domain-containing protein [Chlorobiaceae bacterium]NTW63779.1 DUF1003 domain-containing protein [Chlorobiaceae bacterium]